MSQSWRLPVTGIAQMLEDCGLRVETGQSPPGRDLRAAGDRGAIHIDVAVDATGRVRLTTSRLADDQAMEPLAVSERRFSRVRTTEERITVSGEVTSLDEFRALLHLAGLAPRP